MRTPGIVNALHTPHGELESLSYCPDVLAAADRINVTKILHFTTMSGLVGILASNAVKSRHRLPEDKHLEHVYTPNVRIRKDALWLDYVNLSIERINDWMFETSQRWHANEGNPWVVLSFGPQILSHPGVVFTTTNNIYPDCLRAKGLAGFERMFANQVRGRFGKIHNRARKLPAWPTDRQAKSYTLKSCRVITCSEYLFKMKWSRTTLRGRWRLLNGCASNSCTGGV